MEPIKSWHYIENFKFALRISGIRYFLLQNKLEVGLKTMSNFQSILKTGKAMRTVRLLIIFLCLAQVGYSQNSDDLIIAKRIKINSTILGEQCTIIVSTPSGYDDSRDSYQVLYVIDGVSEIIGHIRYLSDYGVCPQLIIVSIEEVNPARDMFPTKPKFRRGTQPTKAWYNEKDDNELRVNGQDERIGEADKYLSFIESELFPFIDNNRWI
jgi:hypothetical protein